MEVAVATDDAVVASHERLSDTGRINYDWQHYIDLVQRKPGALPNGAPFADMPVPLQRLRHGLLRRSGGDKVMAQVLACVPKAGLEAVLVAVELMVESGALSAEHVLNVLARLNAKPQPEYVETTLQLTEAPLANTDRYDSLRTEVEAPEYGDEKDDEVMALRVHQAYRPAPAGACLAGSCTPPTPVRLAATPAPSRRLPSAIV